MFPAGVPGVALYSDIAAISLAPANDLAESYVFTGIPTLSVLPPAQGEKVMAFGYASSSVITFVDNQPNLSLNPLTAPGTGHGSLSRTSRSRHAVVSVFSS